MRHATDAQVATKNEERPRKLGMPASAARYGGRGAQEQRRISQRNRCDRMQDENSQPGWVRLQ